MFVMAFSKLCNLISIKAYKNKNIKYKSKYESYYLTRGEILTKTDINHTRYI